MIIQYNWGIEAQRTLPMKYDIVGLVYHISLNVAALSAWYNDLKLACSTVLSKDIILNLNTYIFIPYRCCCSEHATSISGYRFSLMNITVSELFVHSFIHPSKNWFRWPNVMTAKTPSNVKRKDGNSRHRTKTVLFVMCGENGRDSFC